MQQQSSSTKQIRQVPCAPPDKQQLERAVILLGAFAQNNLSPRALQELRHLLRDLPRHAQEATHWKSQLKRHRKVMHA